MLGAVGARQVAGAGFLVLMLGHFPFQPPDPARRLAVQATATFRTHPVLGLPASLVLGPDGALSALSARQHRWQAELKLGPGITGHSQLLCQVPTWWP